MRRVKCSRGLRFAQMILCACADFGKFEAQKAKDNLESTQALPGTGPAQKVRVVPLGYPGLEA